jgi:hypothetical protein
MQVMSIYIILGIGADNIFVFADTWKQSRDQCENEGSVSGERRSSSLERRLEWTWPRATRAMSITSLITVCSFMLTNFTDVPLVSTFGTFAAIVFGWNYLLVITWFPACVVLHERYVVQRGRGEGAARCCGCLWPLCSHQGVAKANRFLQDTWYGFLRKGEVRWCVVVVMPLISLLGAVLASQNVQLSNRSISEVILYKKHPLQKTLDLLMGFDPVFPATAAIFNGAGSGAKDMGHWAYGLDSKDVIDRSGTNPFANLDPLTTKSHFEQTRGVSRFNGQNLTSVAFQSKILEDCRTIGRLSSVVQGEVYCFMHDLQMYLESRGRRFPVPPATLVSELRAWTSDLDCQGVGCFENSKLYTSGTGFLAVGNDITFAYIGANLSVPKVSFDMAVVEPACQEWQLSAQNASIANGTQSVDVLGLTGHTLFAATMYTLVSGVWQSALTSVVLSFVILTLYCCNWRVSALAVLTIVGVLGCFLLSFVAQGQKLGVYEAIFLSITAGLSVDFVVLLAHAYNEAEALRRDHKMRKAFTTMGLSVVSAAISTLAASLMILMCSFNFIATYGSFVFFIVFWSLLWSMCFFPALMMTIGPEGDRGDLTFLPWCRKRRHTSKCIDSSLNYNAIPMNSMAAHEEGAVSCDRSPDSQPHTPAVSRQDVCIIIVMFCALTVLIIVSSVVLSARAFEPKLSIQKNLGDNVTYMLQGTQIRLVHVGLDTVCDNPMQVTARGHFSSKVLHNPANFFISISKFDLFLKGQDSREPILHVNLPAPVVLSLQVEESEVALSLSIMSDDNVSRVATAITNLQENIGLVNYTVECKVELTIRIDESISFKFALGDSLPLLDILGDVQGGGGGLLSSVSTLLFPDQQASKSSGADVDKRRTCEVTTACWFTNFEGECCASALNLSGVSLRSMSVHDDFDAIRVQTDALLESPLLRLGAP